MYEGKPVKVLKNIFPTITTSNRILDIKYLDKIFSTHETRKIKTFLSDEILQKFHSFQWLPNFVENISKTKSSLVAGITELWIKKFSSWDEISWEKEMAGA